jgi:probable HAF family extracellular repeat protein
MKNSLAVVVLMGATLATPVQAQLFTYEIDSMSAVDLGTFGGVHSDALDVNDNGDVVGWAEEAGGVRHAFLLRGGNTVKQHVTGEIGNQPSAGNGINNLGWVVGQYEPPQGSAYAKAFVWIEGLPLKTLQPDFDYSKAYAINMGGRIAGVKFGPIPGNPGSPCIGLTPLQWESAYDWHEILWCTTGQNLLRATDINNMNLIVGWEDPGAPHAVQAWGRRNNGDKFIVPKPAAATCGMWAHGVNNSGTIVGRVSLCQLGGARDRAFIWKNLNANSSTLGLLPGGSFAQAYGINDQNFVVGYSQQLVNGGPLPDVIRDRAFIHHEHFGMTALPLPPADLATVTGCIARAIGGRSSSGQIRVAGSCTMLGTTHAVRWDIVVRKKLTNVPPVLL